MPADRIQHAASVDGPVAPRAAWLVDFWAAGRTRAWHRAQLPRRDVYGHYFEARVVSGLWAQRSP